ncbi:hypothetical protein CC78DRAFT_556780 [Lojkania enalia]|uniref:DUF7924 domain-containing protein n=1 Tax=Lojkania enalia TaxID=147567 RepID=A0A9P4N475_9PLEO|nr:hypothetical protein CC78DRAFT_556780 [Didymosphaeria enalia]
MASDSASVAAQKRQRMSTPADKGTKHQVSQYYATIPTFAAQQHQGISKATRRSARILVIEKGSKSQMQSREQVEIPKRLREGEFPSYASPGPSPKRRDNGTWPTDEEEKSMDRFQDIVCHALARKKSSAFLRRKRSDASINTDTVPTRPPSDQQPREQKSAPYRHPRYESQLRGSGVESNMLCKKLLESPRSPPKDTFFADSLFEDTLESIKDRNETRVIRDIAQLIVPPTEILAIRGARHLSILRETPNAGWNNAIPFSGPQRLQKLQPFIGNELEDCSYFAASEVKCGASALNVANRQNAHSQTVLLRGLFELFRLVGREKGLHSEICGFLISHSNVDTVMNILDLWVSDHSERVCSAINMLPVGLNFEVSELSDPQSPDPELASSRSRLSQQLGEYSLTGRVVPDSQLSV